MGWDGEGGVGTVALGEEEEWFELCGGLACRGFVIGVGGGLVSGTVGVRTEEVGIVVAGGKVKCVGT